MSDAPQPPPEQPSGPDPVPAGGWAAPAPQAPAPQPPAGTGWQPAPAPAPAPSSPAPSPPPGWQPAAPPFAPPPSAPPPGWAPAPTPPPQQWAPAPVYRSPAPEVAPAPPRPPSVARPRLVVALALVVAGMSVVLAVLLAILTIDADDFSFIEFTFANRLQSGTSFVNLPVILLLPLALLLAHDEHPPDAAERGLARTVVIGVTVLGAAFSVLAAVRLVADLAGDELFVTTSTAAAAFFDLAGLLVAVTSTYWAYRLLPPSTVPAPRPEPSAGSIWGPPILPPQSPPPPPDWPPPNQH